MRVDHAGVHRRTVPPDQRLVAAPRPRARRSCRSARRARRARRARGKGSRTIACPAVSSIANASSKRARTPSSSASCHTVGGAHNRGRSGGHRRAARPAAPPSPARAPRRRRRRARAGRACRGWSRAATAPSIGIAPSLVLSPTRPLNDAGIRTEPPVSLPTPAAAQPRATATAVPLDDPPGTRDAIDGVARRPGVRVEPEAREGELRHGRSCRGRPRRPRRAARRPARRLPSGGASNSAGEPAPVTSPAVSSRSLTTIGTPSSGPRKRPWRQRREAAAAWCRARSAVTRRSDVAGREAREVGLGRRRRVEVARPGSAPRGRGRRGSWGRWEPWPSVPARPGPGRAAAVAVARPAAVAARYARPMQRTRAELEAMSHDDLVHRVLELQDMLREGLAVRGSRCTRSSTPCSRPRRPRWRASPMPTTTPSTWRSRSSSAPGPPHGTRSSNPLGAAKARQEA